MPDATGKNIRNIAHSQEALAQHGEVPELSWFILDASVHPLNKVVDHMLIGRELARSYILQENLNEILKVSVDSVYLTKENIFVQTLV